MAGKLLLIDDDPYFCQLIEVTLETEGFKVDVAYDAISGLRKAYATSPDLVLLDLMLPDMDGWEACRRFREMSDVPIIMLTALDSPEYAVQGLELGADSYLVKPVTVEELVARIRAVLRRAPSPKFDREGPPAILRYDQLMIDLDRRLVTVDGEPVELRPVEFRLLSVLAQHPGRVLPHNYLLREVWGPERKGGIHSLRLYISYLRRKIEPNPEKPSLILNERGVGYRFG